MFVLRVFEIETGELYREFTHAVHSAKCCQMTGDSTKVISVNCAYCFLFFFVFKNWPKIKKHILFGKSVYFVEFFTNLKNEFLKKYVFRGIFHRKSTESQLGFLHEYLLFRQTILRPKRKSCPRFFKKIFEYLRYSFLICGVLKKGQISTSGVKNDDNSKFSVKTLSKIFFYR